MLTRGVRTRAESGDQGQRRRPSRVVVKDRTANSMRTFAQPMDYGCSTVSVTKQLPTETRT